MPVSFTELHDAYLFLSMGEPYSCQAYICRQTGKIYCHADGIDEEELPDDIEDGQKYLAIPNKHDLDLGKALVMDFAYAFLPDEVDRVRDIFRRRGAYGRFKDLLARRGMIDRWHAFQAAAEEKVLRDWCAENAIELRG
jgi:hypothetical protein